MTEILPEQNEEPSNKDSEISNSSPQSSLPSTSQPKRKLTPWLPGQSGNLGGRPKGSRNRITQQKLGIEEALRDQLNEYVPEVMQKCIEMALKGDRAMIKLLIEMTMSKPHQVEDESHGKERVQITVRKLNLELPKQEPSFIDVKVIGDDDNVKEIEASDGRIGDTGTGPEGGSEFGRSCEES
jgi:hypothetical protein